MLDFPDFFRTLNVIANGANSLNDTLRFADEAMAAGDTIKAERLYRQAAAKTSDNAAVAYNLGVLTSRRSPEEALEYFSNAIAIDPGFALAHYNCGTLLYRTGQLMAAREALTKALELQPDLHDARVNLSLVLFALGDMEDAIRQAHAALEQQPDDPDIFANLAGHLRALNASEDARLCAEAAIRLDPYHPGGWQNLGALTHDARDYAQAIRCYQQALHGDPEHVGSHFNLALAALARGDYELGWQEYEWRRQLPWMIAHYPTYGLPLWQGEALAGKTLLILAEQGHGDTLQFVRLVESIHRQGAHTILMAQPALCRLLSACPWLDQVIAQTASPPAVDYITHLMSLPLHLGLRIDTVPTHIPYLQADPAEVAGWRHRLAGETRRKIGIVWAGDPRPHDPENHRIDQRRSIHLHEFSGLIGEQRVAWYSLQKGHAAAESSQFPQLLDFTDEWQDFGNTAAFVTNLDLVISVDTAVAHLAAALGRPTWLLSRHDACWRWLGNRPNNPWYPDLRIFGQQKPADWASVIEQLAQALAEWPRS